MENDDWQVGDVLSRREALLALGAAGASLLIGCGNSAAEDGVPAPGASTACVVRPEQTEGPYFRDERLHRADIRSDPSNGTVKAGAPLALSFLISQIRGESCVALPGAYVDVWQCDALGVYSDVQDPRFDTTGQKFLRGYQITDANGVARFTTIYPGWYPGRTVHIHFKIRSALDAPAHEFTSQIYFDDAFTDLVHAREPYASKGRRTVRNEGDGIFRRSRGSQLIVAPEPSGDGYAAEFRVALQMT